MDLGRDAFTITYDPLRVDVDVIMRRIRRLGYEPERTAEAADEPLTAAYDPDTIPAPVSDALARARTRALQTPRLRHRHLASQLPWCRGLLSAPSPLPQRESFSQ